MHPAQLFLALIQETQANINYTQSFVQISPEKEET